MIVGRPYWWDGPNAAPPPVKPPAQADIVVIGAGYTGLSAALHAADAGATVAVLEAGTPGQGASTRNGGMFGAHPRLGWDLLAAKFGTAAADGIFAEARTSLEFVRALMERERIDAAHQQTGRIQLAWTARHFEAQQRLAEFVAQKSDVACHIVERPELEREIRTGCYFGGIVFPEHGAIDPKRFFDGLLAAVLRRGVPVVGDCPVFGWQRTPGGFLIETPEGHMRCEKIVLATNGYTRGVFKAFQRRVFPLPSFLIATEPLDPDLIARLAPGRRMMVETRARHSYFRISPDGSRILWGGRASMRPISLARAAHRLGATMAEVWPDLARTRLTHVWTGNTGYSFDHMPSVGEAEGIHYALGYSGSGTVLAPYLGAKAGLRAAGAAGGDTAYADTRLRPSWLNPTGHPLFLYPADFWYRNWVDRLESRNRYPGQNRGN